MTDLLPTITPKSDQLNSDDLIGRTMTITVTKVRICGEADQPIAIHFEGDDGKPFKPCKSMRRVMVQVWGSDGNTFVGRSMTLYRDEKVQFGGVAVGGIRISHMSHIDQEITLALTTARAKRKPYIVRPLVQTARRQAPDQRASTAAGLGMKTGAQLLAEREAEQVHDGQGREGSEQALPDGPADLLGEFDAITWAGELLRSLPDYAGVDALREDWDEHKAELKNESPELFLQLNKAVVGRAKELKS